MKILVWTGILTVVATPAMACSVCFGNPESPLTQALNYGIITLLVCIIGILASLAVFFLKLRQRIKTHATGSHPVG